MSKLATAVILTALLLVSSAAVWAGIPNAPSNPTGIAGLTSILWGWTDNSSNEDAFWVYAGPGPTAPTTVTYTTGANVTSWNQTGLLQNTQYAMQVLAHKNNPGGGESAKTPVITRYTLQIAATTPTFSNIATHSVTVSTTGPVNLTSGQSGVVFNVNGGNRSKVQSLTETLTGLAANTQYTVKATGYNGDGVASATSAAASVYTLALTPVYGTSGSGAINCDKGESGTFADGTPLTFIAVNGFGVGEARASSYKYLWDTNAADPTDWSAASSWTSGPLVLTGNRGTYYLHLVALNGDGVVNPVAWTSGAYTFVPEPSAIVAWATGLISLVGLRRRRR